MDDSAPPLTQREGKSKVKYGSVILFSEDIEKKDPFNIVPLSFFRNSNFPWSSIEGIMSPGCRTEVRTFKNLEGKFRIFGKIETGIEIH